VMGVFVNSLPIEPITFFGLFTLSGAQILFLIGGIAIAAGIITYSHKVMDTVGANLLRLSPLTAFIVVLAESIVLFVFSSERLEYFLVSHGLPALPLVPVSSSQAVVGAVIGIGLIKSYRQIRIKVLAEIATGWVTTPIIAGLITFVFLFFLQNVFNQKVYYASEYLVSGEVISHLQKQNMDGAGLEKFRDKSFDNEIEIFQDLNSIGVFSEKQITEIIRDAKIEPTLFDAEIIKSGLDTLWLSAKQVQAVHGLAGSQFTYRWQVEESLQAKEAEWSYKPAGIFNRQWNRNLQSQYDTIFRTFKTRP
ncbi:MAG: inorganic phosphate transporter, partial [Calditrichales bacterium]